MRTTSCLLFLLLPAAAACGSLEVRNAEPASPFPVVATTAASSAVEPAPVAATAPSQQPQAAAFAVQDGSAPPEDAPRTALGLRSYGMFRGERTLWRDPDFRRRFTESYLAVSDVEPRVTLEERPLLEKVADHITNERFDRAIQLIGENNGPQATAVFDFTLGNIHFQAEDFDAAAQAYSGAVEKFPRFRRAWKNLALIQVRQERFSEAAQSLTRVIETGGADALTYGLLGYSYSNTEQALPAESAYRMATLMDPLTLDWQMGLARSFFDQRRFADAAALCGELIAREPESADLWLLQGNAFIGMGEAMRAAQNFELVERLGKSTAGSLYNLGDIYVNEGVYDLAVSAYARAMQEDGEGNVPRVLRAARSLTANEAFAEVRQLMEAIETLAGDVILPEERKDLLKLEAAVAVAQGQDTEEAEILKQVVALDPLDGQALILLGMHAARQEAVEEAAFYYERAAGIEGFEREAKRRHGQLLVNVERYAEALPLLRRAQSLKPNDALGVYLDQVERLAKSGSGR